MVLHPWLFFSAELLEPLVAAKQHIKYACLKYLIHDNTGSFVYLHQSMNTIHTNLKQ